MQNILKTVVRNDIDLLRELPENDRAKYLIVLKITSVIKMGLCLLAGLMGVDIMRIIQMMVI